MKILLGSNSPRRKELLHQLGFDFETVKIDCEEVYPENIPSEAVAEYLAALKNSAYKDLKANEILITSDTVVIVDDEVLGKPKDEQEAFLMLKKLSGNTHFVDTAICLRTQEQSIVQTDRAEVTVAPLSDEEIRHYIREDKPLDKAGSYGIQDWLGLAKITQIKGSYYTIMGLPTHLLYSHLSRLLEVNR